MKVTTYVFLLVVYCLATVVATPFQLDSTESSLDKREISSDLSATQKKCLEIVKVTSENEASAVYTHALEILKHKLVVEFERIEANKDKSVGSSVPAESAAESKAESKADSIVQEVAARVNKSITAHAVTSAETIINGTCSDKHDGWWYKQHLYHCTEQQNSTESDDASGTGTSTQDTGSEQSVTSASLNGTFFKSVNKTLHYTLGRKASDRLKNSDVNYNETIDNKDGLIWTNDTTIDIQSITTDVSLQIGDKLTQYNSTKIVLDILIDKCQILKSNEKDGSDSEATTSTSAMTVATTTTSTMTTSSPTSTTTTAGPVTTTTTAVPVPTDPASA